MAGMRASDDELTQPECQRAENGRCKPIRPLRGQSAIQQEAESGQDSAWARARDRVLYQLTERASLQINQYNLLTSDSDRYDVRHTAYCQGEIRAVTTNRMVHKSTCEIAGEKGT